MGGVVLFVVYGSRERLSAGYAAAQLAGIASLNTICSNSVLPRLPRRTCVQSATLSAGSRVYINPIYQAQCHQWSRSKNGFIPAYCGKEAFTAASSARLHIITTYCAHALLEMYISMRYWYAQIQSLTTASRLVGKGSQASRWSDVV